MTSSTCQSLTISEFVDEDENLSDDLKRDKTPNEALFTYLSEEFTLISTKLNTLANTVEEHNSRFDLEGKLFSLAIIKRSEKEKPWLLLTSAKLAQPGHEIDLVDNLRLLYKHLINNLPK